MSGVVRILLFVLAAVTALACTPPRNSDTDSGDSSSHADEMTVSPPIRILPSDNSSHVLLDRGPAGFALYAPPSTNPVFELNSMDGVNDFAISAAGTAVAVLRNRREIEVAHAGTSTSMTAPEGMTIRKIYPSDNGKRVALLRQDGEARLVEVLEMGKGKVLKVDLYVEGKIVGFWGGSELERISLQVQGPASGENQICTWLLRYGSGDLGPQRCFSSWQKPLMGKQWVWEIGDEGAKGMHRDGNSRTVEGKGAVKGVMNGEEDKLLLWKVESLDGPSDAIFHFILVDLHETKGYFDASIKISEYNQCTFVLAPEQGRHSIALVRPNGEGGLAFEYIDLQSQALPK